MILNPGDYEASGLIIKSGLNVHGVAGKPRPRLMTSASGWPLVVLNDKSTRATWSASTRLVYAHRRIAVRLRCPAGTVGRCTGRIKLTIRRRSTHRVTLGRSAFSVTPGSATRISVRVTRAGRRLLTNAPLRLRGRATSAASDGFGRAKTTVARVTIRRRHR